MLHAEPEVSVVIPAFNAARFLAQAIDSVLAQVDADLELIVVDDGSTDHTQDILAGYGERLRAVRQPNRGLAAARNAGIAHARGRWIALMDADDVCAPDRIALQLRALRHFPNAVLCCSDFSAFDAQGMTSPSHQARYYSMIADTPQGLDALFGRPVALPLGEGDSLAAVAVRCGPVYEQIAFGNFVHPPTALFSRSAYDAVGGFDESIRYNSDWEFFTRLARCGRFVHLDRCLLAYRLAPTQMSSRLNNRGAGAEDLLKAAAKVWAADPELGRRHPERLCATRRQFHADAAHALSAHRRWPALRMLARARAQGLPLRDVVRTAARILLPRRAADLWRRWRQDPLASLTGRACGHDGLRVSLAPLPTTAALQADWRELETRSNASFFISWAWIGRWLAHLPRHVPRALLRIEFDGRLVGLAVVCGRRQYRRGLPGCSRSLYVNCTGDPALDELTIEYNGLLVESGLEARVFRAALAYFARLPNWDEIFLDGWDRGGLPPQAELSRQGLVLIERATRPCYRVDLKSLRASNGSYVDALPAKVRYKVRRAVRYAGDIGELALDVASGAEESEQFLSELRALHQQSWSRRGHAGSFANPFFSAFHADLATRPDDPGVVQLVRMRVGSRAVAYLYNFRHRGHVYNYQSGFDFDVAQGAAWRPGMACHAMAIAMNLATGSDVYDFMAGDHVYKKELGGEPSQMAWLTLRRPRLKFRIESALRALGAQMLVQRVSRPCADEPTTQET